MRSPIHQKYSTQSHKVFESSPTPAMPQGPKQDENRRLSDASTDSASTDSSMGHEIPTARRKDSMGGKFGSLQSLKRPMDPESTARRSSLQDSYGKKTFIGNLWSSYTRGPIATATSNSAANEHKEPRDISTLRTE